MFTKNDTLSTDLSTLIPQKTSINVIIVHFGSAEDTSRLVDSLMQGVRLPDRLVVVDQDPVPYTCPNNHAICVRPPKNAGYIAGLRFGMHSINASHDSLLVLMNNDSIVTDHFLHDIETWWAKHGGVRVLSGPRLAALSYLTGKARIESSRKPHRLSPFTYIDGACIVGQYSFFDAISNVEKLFMYWEDAALSLNALASGGIIKKIPNVGFTHRDELSTLSDQKLYYLVRNGAYILQHLPFPWGAYWAIKNRIRLYGHSMLGGPRHALIAKALRDAQTFSL